jgi:hypothetical protein
MSSIAIHSAAISIITGSKYAFLKSCEAGSALSLDRLRRGAVTILVNEDDTGGFLKHFLFSTSLHLQCHLY